MDGGGWSGVLQPSSTNYLVDVQAGIIVDVEATPALRTDEVNSARIMLEGRFDLKPARLIGDTAHGAAPMLGWWVEEKRMAQHIPVRTGTNAGDETQSISDFQWDEPATE